MRLVMAAALAWLSIGPLVALAQDVAVPPRVILKDTVLPPGSYPGGWLIQRAAKVRLLPGVYRFSDVPAERADIEMQGTSRLLIGAGVDVQLADATSSMSIHAAGPAPGMGSGPEVRVEGVSDQVSTVVLQGQVVLEGTSRLAVKCVRLVRPPHHTAASGGDTVLRDGALLEMCDATVTPPADAGVDHDTTATQASIRMVNTRYERGSLFLDGSGLVCEGSVTRRNFVGTGIFVGGDGWADVVRTDVDVLGPTFSDGSWGRFADSPSRVIGEDAGGRYAQYSEFSYNTSQDIDPAYGRRSARNRIDPTRFGLLLLDCKTHGWTPYLSNGAEVTLSGFNALPNGFAPGIMLTAVRGPQGQEADLGSFPGGIVRLVDGRQAGSALRPLYDASQIALTLEDDWVTGYCLYAMETSFVRAACDRPGAFYETEAYGGSVVTLHHSDLFASYLSAEGGSTFRVEYSTMKYAYPDIRCIGAGSSVKIRWSPFEVDRDETGRVRGKRVVALDGGEVCIQDSLPGPTDLVALGGATIHLHRSGSPPADRRQVDETSRVVIDDASSCGW